jgi:hypothetical protein
VLPVGLVLTYVIVLLLSGLMMLVLGGVGFRQNAGARVVEVLLGAALVGYAIYLGLFFGGGRVTFSAWVFLGPILGIANVVRARRATRIQQEQLAATYAAEARDPQNAGG